ncbi:adenylate cyclase [Natronospira proteinivora]|uniref:Adenylate cyclase n=1 Tax=Natronospira proteinivora TaxID=1807133 RepID=A0ABT1G6H0_9GAMM|nr:CYTH domain-containing protein [Natronospira proteinivora]MCP1726687.1 adenylate cyclase [Natronospira proteinivora]
MPREIERKYLLIDERWREQVLRSQPFRQGYLSDHRSGRASVRVRLKGDQGELNIKSLELGSSRQEYEYPIPASEAREMLETLCQGPLIEKTRHWVDYRGQVFEIDEFHSDNAGLVVAELELDREDQPVEAPAWLGPEVTHLPRYFNVALAQRPYCQWSSAEKAGEDAD